MKSYFIMTKTGIKIENFRRKKINKLTVANNTTKFLINV